MHNFTEYERTQIQTPTQTSGTDTDTEQRQVQFLFSRITCLSMTHNPRWKDQFSANITVNKSSKKYENYITNSLYH